MTISQSRFGGAAEVGRNHNRPAKPKDRNADKAVASAVAGGAGAVGVSAAKKPLSRHAVNAAQRSVQDKRNSATYAGQAKASMKNYANHKATESRISEYMANPTSRKTYTLDGKRIVLQPGRDKPAQVKTVAEHFNREAAKARSAHISSQEMSNKTAASSAKYGRRAGHLFGAAKHTNKVAGAVGLAGLLGAAKFARESEKSRGTLGYKRPTAHGVKQAQTNRRQEEMKQSAAEGDRYRRMNGM
jgi:hypothetical protein